MNASNIMVRVSPEYREFFLQLLSMLGFVEVVDPVSLVEQYQRQAPLQVPLSEEEVMEEIRANRKGNA
jgi:hypothetical protein